jgi:hypothetical protein
MKAKREPKEVNLDECPQESWSPELLGRYCQVAHRKVALYAHRLGQAFIIAKKNVGHGGWIKWLKTYGFSVDTARRYKLLAENFTEEEVAEVGLMDAFHVLGINNGVKKAGSGLKQGSESTASDKPPTGKKEKSSTGGEGRRGAVADAHDKSADTRQEQSGGPRYTGRRSQESTDEGDNLLTPREALLEELRDALPHLVVQLRKSLGWILDQDRDMRLSCWVEVGCGPVAVEVAGLKEDLARLEEDMPAEATCKAG